MQRWRWVVFLGGLAFLLCGCKEEDHGPKILGPWHLGYKNQHCETCHTLPEKGHTVVNPWECAACHGGNGACNPNGNQSARFHQETDDCITCHISNHSYVVSTQCASCHFATIGRDDDCGIPPMDGGTDGGDPDGSGAEDGDGGQDGGGPVLSDALADNCFNWPQDEFSTTNKASVTTSITDGARAVELTLMDADGNPYTLSELLKTRPVLMVFGAYT